MTGPALETRKCAGVGCTNTYLMTSPTRRFCCGGCSHRKERTLKECPTCGDTFTPQRATSAQQFCSVSCASWGQQRRGPEGPRAPRLKNFRTTSCLNCGSDFQTASGNHKYCSPGCKHKANQTRAATQERKRFTVKSQRIHEITVYRETTSKSQDGKCAICHTELAELGSRDRHVDHCHVTGSLRGVLCPTCNMGIGLFRDNPEVLDRAAEYLRFWSSK